MSLKLRMILALTLLVFVVIVLLSSIFGYIAVNKMEQELKFKAEKDLISKREQMRDAVQQYFGTIEKQIISLSEDVSIIEAAQDFTKAFDSYSAQVTVDSGFDSQVRKYYRTEFGRHYRTKNNDEPDLNRMYGSLDTQTFTMQYAFIANNRYPLGEKDKLTDLNDGSDYAKIHRKYHPGIRKFLQQFGFYDIFIVNPDSGKIIYSVFKELDFATNLKTGPYAQTGIGRAFSRALNANEVDDTFIIDFDEYLPSYSDPASFISSPIFADGQLVGVFIFQMPIERLNNLMTQDKNWKDKGYGDSGEVYLVGPNKKLRNESRFFIEDKSNYLQALHSANIADVSTIEKKNTGINLQPVTSVGVDRALSGNDGFATFPDYRNVPVLSAYGPVKVGDMTWAILAEIDEQEAFAGIAQLKKEIWRLTLIAILLLSLLAVVVANIIANYLLKPINRLSDAFANIATGEGDLTKSVEPSKIKEIDIIGSHFNHFVGQIREIIDTVKQNAQTIAMASESLGSATEQTTQIANLQKQETASVVESMRQFNKALEDVTEHSVSASDQTQQVNSSTSVNTERAELAAENIRQLSSEVERSSTVIQQLQQEVLSINSVLEVINAIADQTNLLALNAAIEAARAGEHGRGFSVVADEVRSLASRTQDSTIEISDKINDLIEVASESVDSMERASVSAEGGIRLVQMVSETLEELKNTIATLSAVNETVASATQEQKYTSDQIHENLEHIDSMSNEVGDASGDIAKSAIEMSELSSRINNLVQRFKT